MRHAVLGRERLQARRRDGAGAVARDDRGAAGERELERQVELVVAGVHQDVGAGLDLVEAPASVDRSYVPVPPPETSSQSSSARRRLRIVAARSTCSSRDGALGQQDGVALVALQAAERQARRGARRARQRERRPRRPGRARSARWPTSISISTPQSSPASSSTCRGLSIATVTARVAAAAASEASAARSATSLATRMSSCTPGAGRRPRPPTPSRTSRPRSRRRASCRRISSVHLWALKCGRSAVPGSTPTRGRCCGPRRRRRRPARASPRRASPPSNRSSPIAARPLVGRVPGRVDDLRSPRPKRPPRWCAPAGERARGRGGRAAAHRGARPGHQRLHRGRRRTGARGRRRGRPGDRAPVRRRPDRDQGQHPGRGLRDQLRLALPGRLPRRTTPPTSCGGCARRAS